MTDRDLALARSTEMTDNELMRLEQELRDEFYAVERAEPPTSDTRLPSLHERPELLKAYERWSRVSTVARQRGLSEQVNELR